MLRTPTLAAGLVQRARIVLLAAEGTANYEFAVRVGVTRPTVNQWRNRYAEQGLAGLDGVRPPVRPRSGDRHLNFHESRDNLWMGRSWLP